MIPKAPLVVWFEKLGREDVSLVGGKNASLGEMVCHLGERGVRVPAGFATTAQSYWQFVDANELRETIADSLAALEAGHAPLAEVGATIRQEFLHGTWPQDIADAIQAAYQELCRRTGKADADVAVRSSATAEDLPDASFAGQQESYLNIRGDKALLDARRRCYASLFTDRAISYRQAKRFDHLKVALSVGVQTMVRSDLGGAGVMFSIDTETGFDKVVLVNAAWGLGENVVQGAVDPDEYQVFKPFLSQPLLVPIIEKKLGEKAKKMVYAQDDDHPTRNVPTSKADRATFVLSDKDILALGRWACVIEEHYGYPMDMEWAKDGESGELFILQARSGCGMPNWRKDRSNGEPGGKGLFCCSSPDCITPSIFTRMPTTVGSAKPSGAGTPSASTGAAATCAPLSRPPAVRYTTTAKAISPDVASRRPTPLAKMSTCKELSRSCQDFIRHSPHFVGFHFLKAVAALIWINGFCSAPYL
jgi:pyruvate,water dikinase